MIALLSANSVTILTFAKDGESSNRTPPTNIPGRNVLHKRYVDEVEPAKGRADNKYYQYYEHYC